MLNEAGLVDFFDSFKRCLECEKWLPASRFCKDNGAKDGWRCYCRTCDNWRVRERRAGRLVTPRKKWRVVAGNLKRCRKCKKWLPLDVFLKERRGAGGRKGICKNCTPNRNNQAKHNHRRRKYGMTSEQYQQTLEHQGGICAVCKSADSGGLGGQLRIDHDHQTGRVRGLLCHNCNVGLGLFKDSPTKLEMAAEYLRLNR